MLIQLHKLKEYWLVRTLLHSYSQVFFSTHTGFALLIFLITFLDFYTGLFGFFSVLMANLLARYLHLEKEHIRQGYYGFNALLTGMGLGIYFEPGWLLLFIVLVASVLSLFMSVVLQGVIGKYRLPHLTLPFIFAMWTMQLAGREFTALGLNERGVYTLNEMYLMGGANLVSIYEWWNSIGILPVFKAYFLSLGAVLFQYSIVAGIFLSAGLLLYSRIAFMLSFVGFFIAWYFYKLIGVPITEISYSYIGFNYILAAIALGGFFIIPRWQSYLWVVIIIPALALLTISLSKALVLFGLPVYSLPFNLVVLGFLYVLQFRTLPGNGLYSYFIQYNSPEKNLYAFTSFLERFGAENLVFMHLPFHGQWKVTQAWNGTYTHKGDWQHAFDFEIANEEEKTYQNEGDYALDYYCYNKTVIAPADGVVEEIWDGIEDNIIGERNLEQNWGNTIIIRHHDQLFSKLSHLIPGSILVKEGSRVKTGMPLARCGNSGNSPYPHLHFQLQSTPFLGSKTLPYALNSLVSVRDGKQMLHVQTVPLLGDRVFNIQSHPFLKAAFHMVPGQKIYLRQQAPNVQSLYWKVEVDGYFNRFLQCSSTGDRAYFKVQDSLFRFTHYEGTRNSLLYYFYLSFQKVSLGYFKNMAISEQLPADRIFSGAQLWWQDFIAPFYRYLTAQVTLAYPADDTQFLNKTIGLKGSILCRSFSSVVQKMDFELEANVQGLLRFSFDTGKHKWEAVCISDSSYS